MGGIAKATDWHPPASSSSSSVVPPGPADGGALDFRNTKMAVLGTLSEEERSALLAVLPRCQKHMDYLGHDPNSGLRTPNVCRHEKKCSRPHAVSAEDPYGDIMKDHLEYFKSTGATNGIHILPYVRGTRARKQGHN